MSEQPDPIGQIEAFAGEFRAKETTLRQAMKNLSDRLVAACHGTQVFAKNSRNRVLECITDEDEIYGYLSFDSSAGIRVAYRSTDDDREPSDRGHFGLRSIDDCPLEWLRTLVKADAREELVQKISAQLVKDSSEMDAQAREIARFTSDPSLFLADSFERIAQDLGYPRAVDEWRNAQAAIHTNPEGAITGACSLIETVCKHILQWADVPLPADQDIQSLWKATRKLLGLDPAGQADPELKGLCGGIVTAVQSIGALRTKYGDAHGKSPEHVSLGGAHARLVVNAAGSVATFIMEQWQTQRWSHL